MIRVGRLLRAAHSAMRRDESATSPFRSKPCRVLRPGDVDDEEPSDDLPFPLPLPPPPLPPLPLPDEPEPPAVVPPSGTTVSSTGALTAAASGLFNRQMPRPCVAAYRKLSGPSSTSRTTVTGRLPPPSRFHEEPSGGRYITPRSEPTTTPALRQHLDAVRRHVGEAGRRHWRIETHPGRAAVCRPEDMADARPGAFGESSAEAVHDDVDVARRVNRRTCDVAIRNARRRHVNL